MIGSPPSVTQLLQRWSAGDREALNALMPFVYDELRRLARSYLRRERPGHTLQSTALVHEAFVRLVDQKAVQWQSRAHFFGIAAQMMRRILVDHARQRATAKRGGEVPKIGISEAIGLPGRGDLELMALDDALAALEKKDPERARIVEMRYFAGLTIEETAEVTGLSIATVERQWAGAKAWLYHKMRPRAGDRPEAG